jgi:hypothetical protein
MLDSPRSFLLDMLPKQSVGIEIGVHRGDFSAEILERVDPRKLYLIDPWKHENGELYQTALYGGRTPEGQAGMDDRYRNVLARFQVETENGTVVVVRSASNGIVGSFGDGSLDWIYIDGNHLYEFVKQDLELYFPKVKAGGFIAGDDFECEGWWGDGVRRAVNEFQHAQPVEVVAIEHNQYIFRKLGSTHRGADRAPVLCA